MNDDWLWNREGKPDPVVDGLEEKLRPLRYDRPAPALPEDSAPALGTMMEAGPASGSANWWRPYAFAFGIVGAAALLGLVVKMSWPTTQPPPEGPWSVVATSGNAPCGQAGCVLTPGQWIETDEVSTASVEVADIGHLTVSPNTRLRLQETGPSQHRLELDRGRIEARVAAPPRLFVVDTPGGRAVDLGCEYALDVDADGRSTISVRLGRVALEVPGRSVFVPAQASATFRPGADPTTPIFDDAAPAMKEALATYDAAPSDPAHLETLLGTASSARDTLVLWHVVQQVPPDRKPQVWAKIEQLVPGTPVDERQEAGDGDPTTLAALWEDLAPACYSGP